MRQKGPRILQRGEAAVVYLFREHTVDELNRLHREGRLQKGQRHTREVMANISCLSNADVRFFLRVPALRAQGRAGKPSTPRLVLEALENGKMGEFAKLCETSYGANWKPKFHHFLTLHTLAHDAAALDIWTEADVARFKAQNKITEKTLARHRKEKCLKKSDASRLYEDGYIAQGVQGILNRLAKRDYIVAERKTVGLRSQVKYRPGLALFHGWDSYSEMMQRIKNAKIETDIRTANGIVLIGTRDLADAKLEFKMIDDVSQAVLAACSKWMKEENKLGKKLKRFMEINTVIQQIRSDGAKRLNQLTRRKADTISSARSSAKSDDETVEELTRLDSEWDGFEVNAIKKIIAKEKEIEQTRLPIIILDLNKIPVCRVYMGPSVEPFEKTDEERALVQQIYDKLGVPENDR
jgi:hypothetical protein